MPARGWRPLAAGPLARRQRETVSLQQKAGCRSVSRVITSLASDGEPVLFREQRYGFNRENIKIFTFRNMYADRCDKGIWRACSPTLVRCRGAG